MISRPGGTGREGAAEALIENLLRREKLSSGVLKSARDDDGGNGQSLARSEVFFGRRSRSSEQRPVMLECPCETPAPARERRDPRDERTERVVTSVITSEQDRERERVLFEQASACSHVFTHPERTCQLVAARASFFPLVCLFPCANRRVWRDNGAPAVEGAARAN